MSTVKQELLAANAEDPAQVGGKGELALPPARRIAILCCMDARIDPARLAGLSEGDAHVICNTVGRAGDAALRSLVIAPIHAVERGRLVGVAAATSVGRAA